MRLSNLSAKLYSAAHDCSLFALQRKFSAIAQALNNSFLKQNPVKYPHERSGHTAYEKWRSMNERFKKEQKLEAKFSAEAQTRGSAAGMELGNFESKWPLYDVFYECCVEGNPADEVEQQCTGSIHRSALPGMQQPKAIDAPGEQPCVCVGVCMCVCLCLSVCVCLCVCVSILNFRGPSYTLSEHLGDAPSQRRSIEAACQGRLS